MLILWYRLLFNSSKVKCSVENSTVPADVTNDQSPISASPKPHKIQQKLNKSKKKSVSKDRIEQRLRSNYGIFLLKRQPVMK